MSAEFLDTNVLVYGHDRSTGLKQSKSIDLVTRLGKDGSGAVTIQVLTEFFSAATKKLAMRSQQAEEVIADFGVWTIHRRPAPSPA
jgi:predicted nucleic acid-binding protein